MQNAKGYKKLTEIIALGTGSAFTMGNWQTNFLISRNGKFLLIDCGSDIRWSMDMIGLSFKDIDAVYISHAHADHIGGLEWLGFTRYFTRKAMLDSVRRGDLFAVDALPLPSLILRARYDPAIVGSFSARRDAGT